MTDTQHQAQHGTTGEYVNWCCRCEECRAAWAGYIRDRKAYIREHGALVPGWRDQLHQNMTVGSK